MRSWAPEIDEDSPPWVFDWGYWYAWSLVAVLQALLFGVCTPLVLPVAALLFALKYVIDKYTLVYGVYGSAHDCWNRLIPVALQLFLLNVAFTDFLLSGFLLLQSARRRQANPNAPLKARKILWSWLFHTLGIEEEDENENDSTAGHERRHPAFVPLDQREYNEITAAVGLFLLSIVIGIGSTFFIVRVRKALQDVDDRGGGGAGAGAQSESENEEGEGDDELDGEEDSELELEGPLSCSYLSPIVDSGTESWSAKLIRHAAINDFNKLYSF